MDKKEPDKYLTEMKELPPSRPAEEKEKAAEKEKKADAVKEVKKEQSKVVEQKTALAEKPDMSKKKVRANDGEDLLEEVGEKAGAEDRAYTYKDVVLGIVNLLSVVFLVIIIVNFPKKSQELKNLKIQEIKNEMAQGLGTTEIEVARPKAEIINKLFLDETGIVNFVNDVELQKSEGGAISKVSFASQKAVTDKTGNYGVPIVIELKGSWEAIDTDLQKIDKLPYLFRPVKVEIEYGDDEENPGVVIYKYGIFLYVRESLGKTR